MFTMQCFRKNQGVALMLALSLSSLFGEIVPLAPADGSTFETLTDEQIAVFGGETRTNRLKIATKLKSAPKEAWQRQRPLVLTWNATEGENEPWRVRLSTRPDFSDGRDLWFDRRARAGRSNTASPCSGRVACRSPTSSSARRTTGRSGAT